MSSTATSTAHNKPNSGVQKLTNRTKKMRFPRRVKQFLQQQEDTGYSDDQFVMPRSNCITIGALLKVGILNSPEWLDKGTPLLIIGSLCFIPGAYHVALAYYAYKEYDGYSFSLIPDLDD
ncbi:hypothetical protein BGZ79_000301 [Entomortierella chlamydospora]|nr:hypothetical protein BGZ79_000301 [Entomortierella chlamydospora]